MIVLLNKYPKTMVVVLCIGFLSSGFWGCTNVHHQKKLNENYLPKGGVVIKVAKVVNDTGFTFDFDLEKMLADALENQLFEKDLLWLGDNEPNLFMESTIIGSSSKQPLTPKVGPNELLIRCELKDDKDNLVGSFIVRRELVIGDLQKVEGWQAIIKSVTDDVAEDIRDQIESHGYAVRPKTLSKKTTDKSIASFSPKQYHKPVDKPHFNPAEPWTGEWRVEGSTGLNGTWVMKQSGKIVKSTKDSYYEFEGKISGNQLKGKIKGDYGIYSKVVLNISSDGQSFKGTWASDFGGRNGQLSGRKE